MNDEELIKEVIKLSWTPETTPEYEQKAMKEFLWAVDGSPKIRKCLEETITIIKKMRSPENDFESIVAYSLQLTSKLMRYHSMYIDKRLDRIEKHLGLELEFGNSSE
jgi:hypothetical protein